MTQLLSQKNTNTPHALIYDQVELRHPATVMKLDRMGCFFPTRLSFMRTLMRRLSHEKAEVTRHKWDMDAHGFGVAVYAITLSGYTYSLIAYSNELNDEDRSDRVIAEAWDSTFVLFDGIPDEHDIARLKNEVPRQEAGRYSAKELVLSRANKSVRLFTYIVNCLSQGMAPDIDKIGSVGYLMRTTAVYGNGKFGIADRDVISSRPGMSCAFQIEMLTVWLIRGYTHDLVEHVAKCKGGAKAITLTKEIKQFLGIGNSTGLGMAPFLVNHPILLSNWMSARETAIARVRAIKSLSDHEITKLRELYQRAQHHCQQWQVDDIIQMNRIMVLRLEFEQLHACFCEEALQTEYAIDQLIKATKNMSMEMQELICALCLEPFPHIVDGLEECMLSTYSAKLDTKMSISTLKSLIKTYYNWALEVDFSDAKETALFWYVSMEKLEPRLGCRYEEPGAEKEQPLDIARQVQNLYHYLSEISGEMSLARFLMQYPQCRLIAERIQMISIYPYQEIQDNLIAETTRPIDMLRCKLSFFGAAKFDPKSDRWTRITLYQGAPLAEDIGKSDCDDWWLPVQPLPTATSLI